MTRTALVVAALLVLLLPSTASATFDQPVGLSSPGVQAGVPDAVMAPDGTAYVVWIEVDQPSVPSGFHLVVARHQPGGSWVRLPSPSTGAGSVFPRIAVNGAGDVAVAWMDEPNHSLPSGDLYVSVWPHESTGWEPSQNLAHLDRSGLSDLAVDDTGRTFVSWTGPAFEIATRPPGTGKSFDLQNLSGSDTVTGRTDLVVTPAGNALVAWATSGDQLHVAGRNAGFNGVFTAPATGIPANGTAPIVALRDDGTAAVMYSGDGSTPQLYASERLGGKWEAPQQITVNRDDFRAWSLEFTTDGTAVGVYRDGPAGSEQVCLTSRPAGAGQRWAPCVRQTAMDASWAYEDRRAILPEGTNVRAVLDDGQHHAGLRLLKPDGTAAGDYEPADPSLDLGNLFVRAGNARGDTLLVFRGQALTATISTAAAPTGGGGSDPGGGGGSTPGGSGSTPGGIGGVTPGGGGGVLGAARLSAALPKGKTSLKLRYGAKTTLTGTLTDASGAPVGRATLALSSKPQRAGGRFASGGTTTTDASGKFTVKLGAGPSRTVRVTYGTASASVTLRVTAGISLTTRQTTVRRGESATFTGRLRGGNIPSGGVRVDLQALSNGHWLTFDTVHANRAGTFKGSLRISRRGGPARYRFRANVVGGGVYPFLTASSKTLKVRVR